MIRSLFAGVAGMKNHQIRMDVIGNNISNVNTVGFKSGRVNFQDTLYQLLKSAGTSTNPAQVGLGVGLAGISNNMNPGGLQFTGRTLDLGINGDGFFKVKEPGSEKYYYTRDGVFYIDQNGYVVNSEGYRLVGELRNITAARATGETFNRVDGVNELTVTDDDEAKLGWTDGTTFKLSHGNIIGSSVKVIVGGTVKTDFTVDEEKGEITFPSSVAAADLSVTYQRATSSLILQGTRADGTLGTRTAFVIDTAQRADLNAGENYKILATNNKIVDDKGDSDPNNDTFLFGRRVEVGDSFVFNMKDNYTGKNVSFEIKVANTPDIANGIVSTTSSIQDFAQALSNAAKKAGIDGEVEMYYTKNGHEISPTDINTLFDGTGNEGFGFRTKDCGPGVSLSITVKDSSGAAKEMFTGTNSEFINGYATATGTGDDVDTIIRKINEQTSIVGVVASKDTQNRLILRTVSTEKDATLEVGGDAAAKLGFPPDQIGVLKNPGNSATIPLQILNGPPGTLNIDSEGIITGTDNKGFILEWEDGSATATNADFAQINLYTFANQDGLQRVNKNIFTTSEASGKEKAGKPGDAGYGTIASGYLEMSNVDLTDEFTNMITTQRGYQASARIITVSDTMLEELLNLKR